MRTSASNEDRACARARLLGWISACWTTQALAAAAQLRLPELLADGPASVQALAVATRCDADALRRLLRALVTLDVVAADDDERFGLGPLGPMMMSDGPGALGAWAEFCGTAGWSSWQRLVDCVRAGASARELAGGSSGLDHLDADPAAALLFNRAMAALSHPVAEALARVLHLEHGACVVDVGGGTGEVLSVLLAAREDARGLLFDRPHATGAALRYLHAQGLAARCEVVAGDFFEAVPAGGDVYVLKSILHDWRDTDCRRILQRCRAAMQPRARLVVVERLLPESLCAAEADRALARSDLNMLVGPGGLERPLSGYVALLQSAGLSLDGTWTLVDGYSALAAACS